MLNLSLLKVFVKVFFQNALKLQLNSVFSALQSGNLQTSFKVNLYGLQQILPHSGFGYET